MASKFLVDYDSIFSGASASTQARWFAADFFSSVVFATPSVAPVYWPGSGNARPLPGLPTTERYDGVAEIQGHLVLWRDDTIKWSNKNDLALWIPLGTTITTLSTETVSGFTQPEVGSPTKAITLLDRTSLFEGQFIRIERDVDDAERYTANFYQVDSFNAGAEEIETIDSSVTIAAASSATLFFRTTTEFSVGAQVEVNGVVTDLYVSTVHGVTDDVLTLSTGTASIPDVGGIISMSVNEATDNFIVGDFVSVGENAEPGGDIYEIYGVRSSSLDLRRLGQGESQATTGSVYPANTKIVAQPAVTVGNQKNGTTYVPGSAILRGLDTVVLTNLGLTGADAPDNYVKAGSFFEALGANEAGETINAGNEINGPIYAIVSLADYGYVLKKNSIQSMQYVGRASGTFFFRPEIRQEGPIGKYAWTKIDSNGIFFIGEEDFFFYAGGSALTPIMRQHSENFYDELDTTRVDEIVCMHNKAQDEVWVFFPTKDSTELKLLIYDYRDESVSEDSYSPDLGAITALGTVELEAAEAWKDVLETVTWDSKSDDESWSSLVEEGAQKYPLIAVRESDPNIAYGDVDDKIPRVLVHGRTYSRGISDDCDVEGYECSFETPDFDLGDEDSWKYIDTVMIALRQSSRFPTTAKPSSLMVQVGGRDNAYSDIRWSDPVAFPLDTGRINPKVNVRKSGRLIRLRFLSNTADAFWAISSYKILGRYGGTY